MMKMMKMKLAGAESLINSATRSSLDKCGNIFMNVLQFCFLNQQATKDCYSWILHTFFRFCFTHMPHTGKNMSYSKHLSTGNKMKILLSVYLVKSVFHVNNLFLRFCFVSIFRFLSDHNDSSLNFRPSVCTSFVLWSKTNLFKKQNLEDRFFEGGGKLKFRFLYVFKNIFEHFPDFWGVLCIS